MLESIPYSFQNDFIQTDHAMNNIVLFRNLVFWLIDIESGKVVYAIDFDTTSIVLPNEPIQWVWANEDLYHLFFLYSKKIVSITYQGEIVSEVTLTGLSPLHWLAFYGDGFRKTTQGWLLGIRLMPQYTRDPLYADSSQYLAYFGDDGQLIKTFGRMEGEARLTTSKFTAKTSHSIAFGEEVIAIKTAYGTSRVDFYDYQGNWLFHSDMGTPLINFSVLDERNLKSMQQGRFQFANSTIDLKWANDTRLVSVTFMPPNDDEKQFEMYQVVTILDLQNENVYSLRINAFQRLFKATSTHLYFLSTHPRFDELCIIKVGYQLVD